MVLLLQLDDENAFDASHHLNPAASLSSAAQSASSHSRYVLAHRDHVAPTSVDEHMIDTNGIASRRGKQRGDGNDYNDSDNEKTGDDHRLVPSSDQAQAHIRIHHPLLALLAAYPVVLSLVGLLDLNDLHALARTAHGIRMSLLAFRLQIVPRTLRCAHEEGHKARTTIGQFAVPCARDLVSPCRRCGTVVCRNCMIKPPSNCKLPQRHRRLCRTCQQSPLHRVTSMPHTLRCRDETAQEKPAMATAMVVAAAAATAFGRGPCTCESGGVYICRSCHTSQHSADVTYTRVWTWRSRYHSLGFGLGTGIGEGNEGVKCGRGQRCSAARDIIVDMDCAEDGKFALLSVDDRPEEAIEQVNPQIVHGTTRDERRHNSAINDDIGHHRDATAGYYRQEIEGIGGVVKKKLKKRVRVAATVTEHEDEREKGDYLDRECSGEARSWCAWCDRVIPSAKDSESLRRTAVIS